MEGRITEEGNGNRIERNEGGKRKEAKMKTDGRKNNRRRKWK
jgi:hypothetical protein